MKIVLLGKQGCGKGTQGILIAKKYKIPHIVIGDILRKLSKKQTKLGKQIKDLMAKGFLIPDEIPIKIILSKIKGKKGFVLDGFPRNLKQVKALEKAKIKFDVAILLHISDKTAIRRLSARRVCSKCKEVYNLITKKPKKKGICDKCKGKLVQREDDKPKAIRKRISIYKKQTKPVLDFYKKQGILKVVDGQGSPEKVFRGILLVLNNKLLKKV